MNTKIVRVAILLAVLFVTAPKAFNQEPSEPPAAAKEEATALNNKSPDETASPSQDPAPAQTPAPAPKPDFWHREKMTGDWDGDRDRLKAEGFEMEFKLTQFYQGVASGGIRRGSEYLGLFETKFKLDLGKMKPGLQWWSMVAQSQTRFGGPSVGGTGTINPVNTAALSPAPDGSAVSVTALYFTRLIPQDLAKGNLFAFTFGRLNVLDLIDEDFFAGSGTERFFNVAQIGPLTALRQIPLITNGANLTYIKGGQPRFSFTVLDPNDHSLDPGLKNLFADGVTFAPSFMFPTKYFGKSAKHTFGGAITTKKYTPFDAIRQIVLPGPSSNPIQPQRGSWSVNYAFRQYIVERESRDGWGFFSQVSFADKDTSPITTFFDFGLGGNGLIKSRPTDEFGISYAYTDLSKVLKDNLNLLTQAGRRPRVEHQMEAFYNFHLTPWLRLTGDLQIIRPTRAIAKTAFVPGARLEMIF